MVRHDVQSPPPNERSGVAGSATPGAGGLPLAQGATAVSTGPFDPPEFPPSRIRPMRSERP